MTPHVLISKTALLEAPAGAVESAEILGKAQVKGRSLVKDHGKVMNEAVVFDSKIAQHARVLGNARVERSEIHGTAEIMERAYVSTSVIGGNVIIAGDAEVIGSKLGCNLRVLDNAKLFNVRFLLLDINSNAVIEGDAELDFTDDPETLYPNTRVSEGYWTRPPLVIETPVFTMVEGVGDRVLIGCLNHSMKFWYEQGKEVLLNYGLDEALYPKFIEALDNMKHYKKTRKSPSARRRRRR